MSIVALSLLVVVYALAAPAVMRSTDRTVRFGALAGAVFIAGGLIAHGWVGLDVILRLWGISALVVAVLVALVLMRRIVRLQRPIEPS